MPATLFARFRAPLKWATRIIGVGFVAYFAYFYHSMETGEGRVTEICRQMKRGMTIEQLTGLAREHGLGPSMPKPEARLVYLAERRTMGRHACRVELENGFVTSATYNYAD